jgi:hypothetical protein
MYVGGDFTSINGSSRARIAAVNVSNWAVTPWNPGSNGPVRAITSATGRVFYANGVNGNGSLRAVSSSSGAVLWSDAYTLGAVAVLQLTPGLTGLYVGGLFDTFRGTVRHGIAKVDVTTGALATAFHSVFAPDVVNGQTGDDGKEPISMGWDQNYSPPHLIVGWGGGHTNGVTELDPTTGASIWGHLTEGDSQGLAIIGKAIVVGNHRNHDNTSTHCPYQYFTSAHSGDGKLIYTGFDPQLSGFGANADGGNGGVQAMSYDGGARSLFLLGAFTTVGASCPTWNSCAGGTALHAIAKFGVV